MLIPISNVQARHEFSIEIGQCFRKEMTVFRIVRTYSSHLEVEHVRSLQRKMLGREELISSFLASEIIPCGDVEVERAIAGDMFIEDEEGTVIARANSTAGKKAIEYGSKIQGYILALRAIGYESLKPTKILELEIKKLSRKFHDSKPPAASTIYRYSLSLNESGGEVNIFVPNYAARGGKGVFRFDNEVKNTLDEILGEYERDPKKRIKFEEIKEELDQRLKEKHGHSFEAAIKSASTSTVTRYVKSSLSAYEICKRNKGKAAADKSFRTWFPRDRATRPREVVEFDDKDTKVFAIDDVTGLPIGRIHLTCGIDSNTTVPMGFSISHMPRSTQSAIEAFANCSLPYDRTLPEWQEVDGDLPYSGGIGISVFDNALYNHATRLRSGIQDISNTVVAFAMPRTPTEKSVVENFNGVSVRQFFDDLPGFGGDKNSKDRLSDGVASAMMSIMDFKQYFLKWAYNVYCNKPGKDGMSPRQRWMQRTQHYRTRYPADLKKIRLACMATDVRKLRTEQLNFKGLIYQSERLQDLRMHMGHNAQVTFKYDQNHLSFVFVNDPYKKEWFEVPNANPEYAAGLSHYQHGLIRKLARESSISCPTNAEYLRFRHELANMVRQLRVSSKLRERRKALKTIGSNDGLVSNDSIAATNETITELEARIMDINEIDIELEFGDEGWTL